ncbi:MAG TPA: hypothetical protein VFI31_18765, partial [Pirellulales bacterium]|nr:hypothetical protein [Pirellulales bacterium]
GGLSSDPGKGVSRLGSALNACCRGLDFQRLRSEISMREALELLAVRAVNGRDDQLYGACPPHTEGALLNARPLLLAPQPPGEEATGTPSRRL